MQIVYTGEEAPEKITKSIFLAGPSLRPNQLGHIDQWRQDAYQILNDIGFDGVVFSPENRDNKFLENFDYDDQVEWEDKHLNMADCIVFWVPRDLSEDKDGNPKLPAFTTNIEWGVWCHSGKVVFGAPKGADKIKYLQYYADLYKIPSADNLTETLRHALEMVGDGAERTGTERSVPLFIWNTDSFKNWYRAQTEAGNELREAKLIFNFRPKDENFVFLWILKVTMYVGSEKRLKKDEFVLSRTDISSVVLWKREKELQECKVAIVKEYRPCAATKDGFIREAPSGSSANEDDTAKEAAVQEIHEETGLMIKIKNLKKVGARQMFGTLSAHKSHLYSYELDDEELKWLEAQKGIVHGDIAVTERTFIEVYTVQELLSNSDLDWSNIGMILSILIGNENE